MSLEVLGKYCVILVPFHLCERYLHTGFSTTKTINTSSWGRDWGSFLDSRSFLTKKKTSTSSNCYSNFTENSETDYPHSVFIFIYRTRRLTLAIQNDSPVTISFFSLFFLSEQSPTLVSRSIKFSSLLCISL